MDRISQYLECSFEHNNLPRNFKMGGLSARTVGTLASSLLYLLDMFIYIKCCLLAYLQKLLYLYSSPSLVASWKELSVPSSFKLLLTAQKIEMVAFVAFKVNKAEIMICAEWDWGISGYLGSSFLPRVS